MDCTRRFFGAAVASFGVLAFARLAFAAHHHHPADQLLGNKINTDGKHEIHKRGDHTIYAHVKGKKISHISVTHKTKGEVPVKKYAFPASRQEKLGHSANPYRTNLLSKWSG